MPISSKRRASLTKQKREEILLNIELKMKNRPLIYTEDGIQTPILTPDTFLNE